MTNLIQGKFILYVCANGNQVKLLAPIARLLEKSGYSALMMSLDRYYDQQASIELSKLEFSWMELAGIVCAGRFYNRLDLRNSFITEAALEIESLMPQLGALKCVVLGHDVEHCEQFIVRASERLSIPTVRIQDGSDVGVEIELGNRVERTRHPFDGGCDLNIVWAAGTLPRLRQRGVSGEIIAAGNLRLDPYINTLAVGSEFLATKPHGPPWKVLLCLQCFSRHHQMTLAQEIEMYQGLIESFLQRPDVVVEVKLHPLQQQPELYHQLIDSYDQRVVLCPESDSIAAIRQCSVVAGVASTVLIESVLLGIPTMCLIHALKKDSPDFIEGERKFREILFSADFPERVSLNVPSREESIKDQGGVLDGRAGKRAAEAILSLIEERELLVNIEYPAASVLIDCDEGNPLDAIRSILRTPKVAVEIVFLDRSADQHISRLLRENITDQRLRIYSYPAATQSAAINAGISHCRTDVILRLAQYCIASPNWADNLGAALSQNPQAVIAFSWCRLRDSVGSIWWQRILSDQQDWQELLSAEDIGSIIQSYAFRKNQAVALPPDLVSADAHLIVGMLSRTSEKSPIVVAPKCLFITEFDASVYSKLGPAPSKGVFEIKRGKGVTEPRTGSIIFLGLDSSDPTKESKLSVVEQLKLDLEKSSGELVLCLSEGTTPSQDLVAQHFSEHAENSKVLLSGTSRVETQKDLLALALSAGGYFGLDYSNWSISHRLLQGVLARPTPDLWSGWGMYQWIVHQSEESGFRIQKTTQAVFNINTSISLTEFIEREILRKRDLANLAKANMKFARLLLDLPQVTTADLSCWRDLVKSANTSVITALTEIEKTCVEVDSLVVTNKDPERFVELVRPISEMLTYISDHFQYRELVRCFLNEAEFSVVRFKDRDF